MKTFPMLTTVHVSVVAATDAVFGFAGAAFVLCGLLLLLVGGLLVLASLASDMGDDDS